MKIHRKFLQILEIKLNPKRLKHSPHSLTQTHHTHTHRGRPSPVPCPCLSSLSQPASHCNQKLPVRLRQSSSSAQPSRYQEASSRPSPPSRRLVRLFVVRFRKRDQPAFCVGWKWHDAGANAIHNECCKRRLKVPIIGVPKTIDNDILLTDKTFGFNTAVEEAQRAINSAYIEAHSAYHGIGIVKLMGRSSGFIAMHASLANGQVDICLIPEVPFTLHGPDGDLSHLKYLIETKGSAVVCVAEGAGQNLLPVVQRLTSWKKI